MSNTSKKHNYFYNKKQNGELGFGIVEALLTVTIFTIVTSGMVLLFVNILESTNRATIRNQASLLAAEGLEIVKTIAIDDFETSLFSKGDNPGDDFSGYLEYNVANSTWSLISGSPENITFTYDDGTSFDYERAIKISEMVSGATASTSKKIVESVVTWDNENHNVSFYTLITGWRD